MAHAAFAIGALPLIFAAMSHFVPVLTRSGGAEPGIHRLPLVLRFPDGSGLRLPDLPPPWDALLGIARARGWSWGERLALLRVAHT